MQRYVWSYIRGRVSTNYDCFGLGKHSNELEDRQAIARHQAPTDYCVLSTPGEHLGILKNAGEGTALRVAVRNYSAAGLLADEVDLYPVTPGEEIKLDYLQGADKLVAAYVNLYGQDPYRTTCLKHANKHGAC